MSLFIYSYIDAMGHHHFATQQAEDAPQCCRLLKEKSIIPISFHALPLLEKEKITNYEMALLFRQLSMALKSGVSLLDALSYISKEQHSERLCAFIDRLQKAIFAGQPFSESLKKEKGLPPMLGQWLAIGEKQGKLAEVMEEAANHLDSREKMKKRIQQQLLYPTIVLLGVLIVGAFLTLVVMPMLAQQFMDTQTEITGIMRFFLVVHDVLVQYGGFFLLLLAMAFCILIWQKRCNQKEEQKTKFFRKVILAVPILKKYFILKGYVPFSRFLGQLLSSGVSLSEAMPLLQQYFSHSVFEEDVAVITKCLSSGKKISQGIADAAFVPPLARQMLLNGERYGKLPEALLRSAEYYETVLFEELNFWIRFMEPVAVVILGLLVLLMALGLFLPILDSYQSLLMQ